MLDGCVIETAAAGYLVLPGEVNVAAYTSVVPPDPSTFFSIWASDAFAKMSLIEPLGVVIFFMGL